jgi:excisionase family DNA binding protein
MTLTDDHLYTIDEATEVLRCRRSWLRDQVTAGTVPHLRLGKVKGVRFTADDLMQIAATRARPVGAVAPAAQTQPQEPAIDPYLQLLQ